MQYIMHSRLGGQVRWLRVWKVGGSKPFRVKWSGQVVGSVVGSSQRLRNWHLLLPWLAFTI